MALIPRIVSLSTYSIIETRRVMLFYLICVVLYCKTFVHPFTCNLKRNFITNESVRSFNTALKTISSVPFNSHHDNDLTSDNDHYSIILQKLVNRFQGDFDNYDQVVDDRKNNLLPKEGGGHEHFHATLIPIPTFSDGNRIPPSIILPQGSTNVSLVLAAYYLDGMPNRIFRLRLYAFYVNRSNRKRELQEEELSIKEEDHCTVEMKLYTLPQKLEIELRRNSQKPIETWIPSFTEFIAASMSTETSDENNDSLFVELKRCDIAWSNKPDPSRHKYLFNTEMLHKSKNEESEGIHAIMKYDHDIGGVLLESQMNPGVWIRVQDELSLWQDELWINDRGFNANTKSFVYGNQRGIPYKLKRVSTLLNSDEKDNGVKVIHSNNSLGQLKRKIIDPSLSWTLGDDWRNAEEYESKMELIGGVSSKLNKQ